MNVVPFVIAELGASHDAEWDKMVKGIRAAAWTGADAFKTAWWSSPERACERLHAPEMLETYRRCQWPADWLPRIRALTWNLRIEFLCTVDCVEDLAVVAPHVDRLKIASWGASDPAFVQAHVKVGKPVVLSTGAHDRAEIEAWAWRLPVGCWRLHCVSAYPAPPEELNLSLLRDRDLFDGLSDHTRSIHTGAWAVCAGARVLEVHFRLDETRPDNPDWPVSLTPAELAAYIRLARLAHRALGDGIKRVMPSEEGNRRFRYV